MVMLLLTTMMISRLVGPKSVVIVMVMEVVVAVAVVVVAQAIIFQFSRFSSSSWQHKFQCKVVMKRNKF
jgi:hypothetical protein